MFKFLSKTPEEKLNSILKKESLSHDQLLKLGTINFSLEVEESKRAKVESNNELQKANLKPGASHSMGLLIFEASADAITILTALISVTNFLGNNYYVTIGTSEGPKRVPLKDAINHYINSAKNNK